MSRNPRWPPFGPEEPLAHPSTLAIEQVAFGSEDTAIDPAIADHIEACAECTSRVRILREERTAYQAVHPSAAFMARLDEKTNSDRGRIYRGALSGFAVAVALGASAVFVALPSNDVSMPTGVRMKGTIDLALRLHVSRHGEPAAPFDVRDPLRPGDIVRFVVDAPAEGYPAVVSIDERQQLSWYVPTADAQARPLAAGRSIVLPGAIQLDDYLGRELVILIMSETPVRKSAIEKHVHEAIARADGDLVALHRRGWGPNGVSLLIAKGVRR